MNNGKKKSCHTPLARVILMCLLGIMSAACSDVEDSVYRDHACYFAFDTALHPLPCHLTSALGNTGQFLKVSTRMVSGVRHIMTTRNYDQQTEDIMLTTKKENETRCILGANNAIIIGRSNYTGYLICYEGQCPNCMKDFGGNNYPLTWNANGLLLCRNP